MDYVFFVRLVKSPHIFDHKSVQMISYLKKKLDGVAPLITDPPPTSFTSWSEKRKEKCDNWHMTHAMGHVKFDM